MSETKLLVTEVIVVLYILIGLYVATVHPNEEDISDTRWFLEELGIAVFWLPLLIKWRYSAGIAVVLVCIGALSALYLLS